MNIINSELFQEIHNKVSSSGVFQKKKQEQIKDLYNEYPYLLQELNEYLESYLKSANVSVDEIFEDYTKLNDMMTEEKMNFLRTGEYSCSSFNDSIENIYSNTEYMESYMTGLMISQILWPAHYRIFNFYISCLEKNIAPNVIEIGAGHGLFAVAALKRLPLEGKYTCIDISKKSLAMTQMMINSNQHLTGKKDIELIEADFICTPYKSEFNFGIMGEVLEHVPDPLNFLKKMKELLLPGSCLFTTTVINSPAVDHIYHFKNINEVCELFDSAGFEIVDLLAIPEKDIPEDKWEKKMINVNVAAILKKSS